LSAVFIVLKSTQHLDLFENIFNHSTLQQNGVRSLKFAQRMAEYEEMKSNKIKTKG